VLTKFIWITQTAQILIASTGPRKRIGEKNRKKTRAARMP
jgi:hypothetical protein